MRITNRIIRNNSLNNINNNKILQDKLSNQIASEKKIQRPSDDPIIALRSLRLRTSVNQTEQYKDKNAKDAESWLKVTEDAINTLSDIITDIRKQYVKGTSDTLTSADRQIIIENLEALAAEIYNTGNADFAGRSVFTGYRTDSDLTFQKNDTLKYQISENESTLKIDDVTHVYYDKNTTTDETGVTTQTFARIRLSYSDVSAEDISVNVGATAYTATASNDVYADLAANPDGVFFDAATGEIFIGANIASNAEAVGEDVSVTYTKDKWVKGDLRPEHYFNCQDVTDATNPIVYDLESSSGEIEYNIGVNQTLRINTKASECFNHDIRRDLEDVIQAIKNVDEIESTITGLESKLAGLTEGTTEYEETKLKLDAAKKASTYLNDTLSTKFGNGITSAEGYLTRNNLALTNSGTRSKRLELISNRLDTQLSTLKELKSDNEDVDMAEIAVKLSSAEYAYDAALMATGKILQQSLLNYL